MDKDEALRMALEALQEIALAGMSGSGQESDEALTAWHARQAWKFIGIAARALEPIKQALAAPVQKPVAWVPYLSDRADGVQGHYAIARWNPRGYREVWNLRRHAWGAFSDDVMSLEEADYLLQQITIPTRKPTPPAAQRQWIRLTRGEVGDLRDNGVFLGSVFEIADAIEAKLCEKNSAQLAPREDPMLWRLPCDVRAGGHSISKGCTLQGLVAWLTLITKLDPDLQKIPENCGTGHCSCVECLKTTGRTPLTMAQRLQILNQWIDRDGTGSELIEMVEAAHDIKEPA